MNKIQSYICPSKENITFYIKSAKSSLSQCIDKTTQFIKENKSILFWALSLSFALVAAGLLFNFTSTTTLATTGITSLCLFLFRCRYPAQIKAEEERKPSTTLSKGEDKKPLEAQKKTDTTSLASSNSKLVLDKSKTIHEGGTADDNPSQAVIDKFMSLNPRQTIASKATISSFIQKGGLITFLEVNEVYILDTSKKYLVGCTAGYNRSQIMYRLLKDLNLQVIAPPIAGYFSMMNPSMNNSAFIELNQDDNMIFKTAVGHSKVPQLGWNEIHERKIEEREAFQQTFYQDFINKVDIPVTIIGFCNTPESLIARFVASGRDLKGVEIIYCNVDDEIKVPKDRNIIRDSAGAYMAFYDKMKAMFVLPT